MRTAAIVVLVLVALTPLCGCATTSGSDHVGAAWNAWGTFLTAMGWVCKGVGAAQTVTDVVHPTSGGDDGEEPHTIDEVP